MPSWSGWVSKVAPWRTGRAGAAHEDHQRVRPRAVGHEELADDLGAVRRSPGDPVGGVRVHPRAADRRAALLAPDDLVEPSVGAGNELEGRSVGRPERPEHEFALAPEQ